MSKRVCKVCGRTYEYCPTCYRDSFKPRWMISFDDEKCKKLWDIVCSHGAGQIGAKEALVELKAIDYKSLMIENKEILGHIAKIETEASDVAIKTEVKAETAEVKAEPKAETKKIKPVVQASDDTVTLAINRAKEIMRHEAEG